MNGNAAQADRAWERLHKRGWKCKLFNSEDPRQLPWSFVCEKNGIHSTSYATSRVEAVLLGAKNVEDADRTKGTA